MSRFIVFHRIEEGGVVKCRNRVEFEVTRLLLACWYYQSMIDRGCSWFLCLNFYRGK